VVSVQESTPLAEVVALMQNEGVKRLPVLRGQSVVGIVSRSDLLRLLGDRLAVPAPIADDTAILRAVVDGLADKPWAQGKSVTVAVDHGVVLLDGCVFDIREREAMGALAKSVPGVARVENRLVCVDALSGALVCDPCEAGTRTDADKTAR
jgi:CBS domain-containing protein